MASANAFASLLPQNCREGFYQFIGSFYLVGRGDGSLSAASVLAGVRLPDKSEEWLEYLAKKEAEAKAEALKKQGECVDQNFEVTDPKAPDGSPLPTITSIAKGDDADES